MRYFDEKTSAAIDRVLSAETDNFAQLVRIAGLSPEQDFRRGLLRDVDFRGSDLDAFDFGDTTFETCRFAGARLGRARFMGARFKACDPRHADDWGDRPTPTLVGVATGSPFGRKLVHDLSWSPANRRLAPSPGVRSHATDALAQSGGTPAPRRGFDDIVRTLVAERRHPVLLVGAPAAGKSVLIHGMLHAARFDPKLSVSLGEIPNIGEHARDDADHLFHAVSYHPGKDVPRTYGEPFFVPLDLDVHGSGTTLKLAVLESSGEAFDLRRRDDFPPLVESVLRHFPLGLSLVFVAPAERRGALEPIDIHDIALAHAMDRYSELRSPTARKKDRFLFALSGAAFGGSGEDLEFDRDTDAQAELSHFLENEFPLTLPRYGAIGDKAGLVVQLPPIAIVASLREALQHDAPAYRAVLDWIAENAIHAAGKRIALTDRRALKAAFHRSPHGRYTRFSRSYR